jgi:ribonuclease T1
VRLIAALVAVLCVSSALGFSRDVAVKDLPSEARQTLELIKSNGRLPYKQDGRTFHNREGRLPKRAQGYYREYTVKTPGAQDRGARRIVAGNGGEFYYTEDHYRSFRRIRE